MKNRIQRDESLPDVEVVMAEQTDAPSSNVTGPRKSCSKHQQKRICVIPHEEEINSVIIFLLCSRRIKTFSMLDLENTKSLSCPGATTICTGG